MSFTDKHAEVLFVLVSINVNIGNDIYKGQYVCDILDYNTATWCNFDDDTITQYPGYAINVYDDLSIDKKKEKCVWMDQIGLLPCYILKNKFLHRSPTLLLQGSQYQKILSILRIQ